ncbi:MAG TPA: glycosyltransferase [Stellaceae bacterium]|nr:glycosyltransferase [Stellaceae bacterium]
MKVLHLITDLNRGGAETMLARIAQRLDLPSLVVSLMNEGVFGSELRAHGVPVVALGLKRGQISPAAIFRLRRIIRREQPQILQSWLYHADLLALLASASLPDLRLVWNLRCSDMDLAQYRLGTRIIRWILARTSTIPAAIVVNSEAGQRFHAAVGYRSKRWVLIPNGFDTDEFRPNREARNLIRRLIGASEEQLVVGMVARVDPMKDYPTFIAAAERVAAARPNTKFLVVGRGTEELSVPPSLISRFHAFGERDDVSQLLPALDVLVLSSAFGEGFPNVLGEAMACGVPCVATDVGDAASIISDTGIIVPRRDPIALSESVVTVLSRGQSAGRAARQRVLDHYSIAAVAQCYRALYDDLM